MKQQRIKIFLPQNGSAGFSLVELMVAVAIVGILASTATQGWNVYRQKTMNAWQITDLKGMEVLVKTHYFEHGNYPVTALTWWLSSHPQDATTYRVDYIPGFTTGLPVDPEAHLGDSNNICAGWGWKRAYLYQSDGVDYKILSHCSSNLYTGPFIDPLRDGGAMVTTPDGCIGTGSEVWALAVYSPGARCW